MVNHDTTYRDWYNRRPDNTPGQVILNSRRNYSDNYKFRPQSRNYNYNNQQGLGKIINYEPELQTFKTRIGDFEGPSITITRFCRYEKGKINFNAWLKKYKKLKEACGFKDEHHELILICRLVDKDLHSIINNSRTLSKKNPSTKRIFSSKKWF